MLLRLIVSFVISGSMAYAVSDGLSQKLIVISTTFEQENYEYTMNLIDEVESHFNDELQQEEKVRVNLDYWRGICLARTYEYEEAAKYLLRAIRNEKYLPNNIYYEYGQANYAIEEFEEAEKGFLVSTQKNFKKGVSFYYLGHMAQKRQEFKKATKFYMAIEDLPEEENKDVIQAARMQLGDIYYEMAIKLENFNEIVEFKVIPQYEKALEYDKKSPLAVEIKSKIEQLKQRFELDIFKMRNGRLTARPPFFFKVGATYGYDSNVLTVDRETADALNATAAPYMSTNVFGRYSFYPNSIISFSPEMRLNYTKYQTPDDTLGGQNRYNTYGGLKMNYEHSYFGRIATLYLNYEMGQDNYDVDMDGVIEKRNTTTNMVISEELNFRERSPSTFRYRVSDSNGVLDTYTYVTKSYIYEQFYPLSKLSLFSYLAYDQSRYDIDTDNDTNSLSWRLDFIFKPFFNLFNPILYGMHRRVTYLNQDDNDTQSNQAGMSFNRPIGRHWFLSIDVSTTAQTSNADNRVYNKQVSFFTLEYIY